MKYASFGLFKQIVLKWKHKKTAISVALQINEMHNN